MVPGTLDQCLRRKPRTALSPEGHHLSRKHGSFFASFFTKKRSPSFYPNQANKTANVPTETAVETTTVLADASAIVANRRASMNAFAPVGIADASTTTLNATPVTPTK
jgi:hypothetical protein